VRSNVANPNLLIRLIRRMPETDGGTHTF
jgi:hypothetical protein